MKTRFIVILLALLLSGGGQASTVKVKVTDDRLTLHAEKVSMQQVLEALSKQSGIKIRNIGEDLTKSTIVSVDIKDQPLEKGMRELLRDWNHVLVKDDKTSAIHKIMILGKLRDSSGVADTEGMTVSDDDVAVSMVETSSPTEPVVETVADALLRVNQAKKPEDKAVAIVDLARYQNSDTLGALRPALDDKDESIRQAALESMRWSNLDDPESLAKIREMALTDVANQRQALEVLVRYDTSEEGKSVLQKIASEGGGTMSSFATRELQRMEYEAASAHEADMQVQQATSEVPESDRDVIPASQSQDLNNNI